MAAAPRTCAPSRKSPRKRYHCYLLRSLDPGHARSTYIGFTVDPCRRIRQHNGEIKAGAYRTKKKRPWQMAAVVYGFPSKSSALQFEWAWQHPAKDRHMKGKVGSMSLDSRRTVGLRAKLAVAKVMLCLQPWSRYGLSLWFTSGDAEGVFRRLALPSPVPSSEIADLAMDTGSLQALQLQQGGGAATATSTSSYDGAVAAAAAATAMATGPSACSGGGAAEASRLAEAACAAAPQMPNSDARCALCQGVLLSSATTAAGAAAAAAGGEAQGQGPGLAGLAAGFASPGARVGAALAVGAAPAAAAAAGCYYMQCPHCGLLVHARCLSEALLRQPDPAAAPGPGGPGERSGCAAAAIMELIPRGGVCPGAGTAIGGCGGALKWPALVRAARDRASAFRAKASSRGKPGPDGGGGGPGKAAGKHGLEGGRAVGGGGGLGAQAAIVVSDSDDESEDHSGSESGEPGDGDDDDGEGSTSESEGVGDCSDDGGDGSVGPGGGSGGGGIRGHVAGATTSLRPLTQSEAQSRRPGRGGRLHDDDGDCSSSLGTVMGTLQRASDSWGSPESLRLTRKAPPARPRGCTAEAEEITNLFSPPPVTRTLVRACRGGGRGGETPGGDSETESESEREAGRLGQRRSRCRPGPGGRPPHAEAPLRPAASESSPARPPGYPGPLPGDSETESESEPEAGRQPERGSRCQPGGGRPHAQAPLRPAASESSPPTPKPPGYPRPLSGSRDSEEREVLSLPRSASLSDDGATTASESPPASDSESGLSRLPLAERLRHRRAAAATAGL